jgi:hypothetical protein
VKTRPEKDMLPADAPPDSDARAKLLLDINNALVSNLDLRDLIKNIGECLREYIRFDLAALYWHEPGTDYLRELSLDTESSKKMFEKGVIIPIEGSQPRHELTGDWDGERTRLREKGIDMKFRLTQIYQGTDGDGGVQRQARRPF